MGLRCGKTSRVDEDLALDLPPSDGQSGDESEPDPHAFEHAVVEEGWLRELGADAEAAAHAEDDAPAASDVFDPAEWLSDDSSEGILETGDDQNVSLDLGDHALDDTDEGWTRDQEPLDDQTLLEGWFQDDGGSSEQLDTDVEGVDDPSLDADFEDDSPRPHELPLDDADGPVTD